MECWGNMPHERDRLFKLIDKTNANGCFFISGDVHFTELSVAKGEGPYPLYDLTASGLNQSPENLGINQSIHTVFQTRCMLDGILGLFKLIG